MKMKKTLWLVAGLVGCMCAAQAGVIYSNSFDEAAGTAGSATVPEISRISSYYDASLFVETDGGGRLQANTSTGNANYRVRLSPAPLTDDPSLAGARISGKMRIPANTLVAIGFQGKDSNALTADYSDAGVYARFATTWMNVYGGNANLNAATQIDGGNLPYAAGEVVDFEISYDFSNQTATVVVNGNTVYDDVAITHTDYTSGLTEDPELNWVQIQFYNQPTAAAGGAYVEHLVVETIPVSAEPGTTIYQDDFSGAAADDAKTTVPEVSPAGFLQKSWQTGLDGNGRLGSANPAQSAAGYRVRLATDPLTDDSSISAVRCTINLRTPTNDWLMVGFQEADANGFLDANNNVGPVMQFNPSSVKLRGGTWGGGNIVTTVPPFYSAGEEITAVLTYHTDSQTMDFSVNDFVVTNGVALNHVFPLETSSDAVVLWLGTQFSFQPTAADGGACISSIQVEAIAAPDPDPGYAGWAAMWGIDIGAETNDYDEDGLLNIYEYGLGGDPTNEFDQGASSVCSVENVGGTNWFGFVHPQLSDPDCGLSYSLELTTSLLSGTWTNAGYAVLGTNVTGGDLDYVTNVTETVDSQKFIRLIIE